ncbi:MAG: phosphoribosylformimino-5-aminoimidazole carboxamide ribotide isomerase [Candidatus Methanoperedens sp.]|nr:phosphoribosylformimino-5-aminoimidazole carboxamide ribotide isomerase [Candidatus Methanoperedens sp.]
MFRIIFVMDILNGIVVHAVRGERAKYRPVENSRICDSSDPLEMISTIMPSQVYIADLDHIQEFGDNFGLIEQISRKTNTMVDIGVKNMDDVRKCAKVTDTVIIGTETASLETIEKAAAQFPGRINVSMDMKNGIVLTKDLKMDVQPEKLIRKLNEFDLKDIIILDLGKVGTSTGINTDFLKEMAGISTHKIIVGGGIKDLDDIVVLQESGIDGALVATAVHNGKIPIELIH